MCVLLSQASLTWQVSGCLSGGSLSHFVKCSTLDRRVGCFRSGPVQSYCEHSRTFWSAGRVGCFLSGPVQSYCEHSRAFWSTGRVGCFRSGPVQSYCEHSRTFWPAGRVGCFCSGLVQSYGEHSRPHLLVHTRALFSWVCIQKNTSWVTEHVYLYTQPRSSSRQFPRALVPVPAHASSR